jgi:hypothetical protein
VLGIVATDEGSRYPRHIAGVAICERTVAAVGADPRVVQQRGDLVVGAYQEAAVVLTGHAVLPELGVGHLMPDHVHMLISIPPKYAVSQVVGFIKGKSAIHLARVYGERKRNFVGQHF